MFKMHVYFLVVLSQLLTHWWVVGNVLPGEVGCSGVTHASLMCPQDLVLWVMSVTGPIFRGKGALS